MTIEMVIDLAFKHLQTRGLSDLEIRALLYRFSKEQLCMDAKEAMQRAKNDFRLLQEPMEKPTYREFYIWYYFNDVVALPEERPHPGNEDEGDLGDSEVIIYAIIKVIAKIGGTEADEAVQEWQSNCNYEIASSEELSVLSTEFIGATFDRPVL